MRIPRTVDLADMDDSCVVQTNARAAHGDEVFDRPVNPMSILRAAASKVKRSAAQHPPKKSRAKRYDCLDSAPQGGATSCDDDNEDNVREGGKRICSTRPLLFEEEDDGMNSKSLGSLDTAVRGWVPSGAPVATSSDWARDRTAGQAVTLEAEGHRGARRGSSDGNESADGGSDNMDTETAEPEVESAPAKSVRTAKLQAATKMLTAKQRRCKTMRISALQLGGGLALLGLLGFTARSISVAGTHAPPPPSQPTPPPWFGLEGTDAEGPAGGEREVQRNPAGEVVVPEEDTEAYTSEEHTEEQVPKGLLDTWSQPDNSFGKDQQRADQLEQVPKGLLDMWSQPDNSFGKDQQRADQLNARFAAGVPSDTLASAGVLLRQFDSLSSRDTPWLPCSQATWCGGLADRWSASLVNPTVRRLYDGSKVSCIDAREGHATHNTCALHSSCATLPGDVLVNAPEMYKRLTRD